MEKKITIKKQETKYILSDGQYVISVIVSGDGQSFGLYRQQFFNQDFQFHQAKPEVIKAIANLFLEAIKLQ